MTGADDLLAAALRSTPGVATLYPARGTGRLLAALDPAATPALVTTVVDGDGTRTEVSVGLDGTVPAPAVGRDIAAAVAAAGVPGEVVVRVVGFD